MNSPNTFSLFQGTLTIQSNQSEDILWKGKPNGIDVYQVFPIPESTDYIILLEYSSAFSKNKKNLIRLNPSGDILWEVGVQQIKNLPGPDRVGLEIYTGITQVNRSYLFASSFSCYSDKIDIQTGEILESVFVK